MDKEFLMGQMSANIVALTEAVSSLNKDLRMLRDELNNINLFKAKVIGMSIGASAIVSFLVQVASAWVR